MADNSEQVAIITGAAGGMGSAIAREFAAQGRALTLCDRAAESLEMFAASITTVPVTIVAGDITDPDYLAQIITALGGRKISALAHAAGVSPSMADGPRVFEINQAQPYADVRNAIPFLRERGVIP